MKMGLEPPSYNVKYLTDPTQETLRELALSHVLSIVKTAYNNLDKITRFKARQAARTYIVAPEGEVGKYSGALIERHEAERLIEHQRAFIEKSGQLIQIDSYQGLGKHAIPVQWLFTFDAAN